jgi:hypothetical protein
LSDSTVITHVDTEANVTLPRRGSKLYEVLVALVGLKTGTTADITAHVNQGKPKKNHQTSSNVASRLTVLGYKGLVENIDDRKGAIGGSTWSLTAAARKFFPQASE